ncbi:MAG: tryptophan 7-halogenase [Blastocatellia bacterium]|nr:tryptophan 7-halogenase [Blastocatellia bacterium]
MVIGGGVAGSAAALSLLSQGVSDVLVIEASQYEQVRIGESVPPDIRLLLLKLGVWETFLSEGHEPCLGSCSLWGDDRPGYNDFLFNPHGHGWHLNRQRFDAFLAESVKARDIKIESGIRFQKCEEFEDGVHLWVKNRQEETIKLSAHFVIDATGQSANLAKGLGAKKQLLDQLVCMIGFFELSECGDFTQQTLLEAVEDGWWYVAKLPNRRVVAAFATDREVIKQTTILEKEAWLNYLKKTTYIGEQLTECSFIEDSLIVRQAPSFLLDRSVGKRWLAVGDAASTFDPISSQGIYKALADGIEAGAAISNYLSGNKNNLDGYDSFIKDRFQDYLNNRNYFYSTENRWPESRFWKNRRSRGFLT